MLPKTKKMKKLFLPFAILATIGLTIQACNIKDEIIKQLLESFVAKIADFEVTIPVIDTIGDEALMGGETVYFNLDSTVRSHTDDLFNIDDVTNVFPETVVLTLTGTESEGNGPDADNNLANFEQAKITLYSNSNENPIEFEIPNNPDEYATTLSFPVDKSVDMKSYLTGSTYTYTISGKARRTTTRELKCNLAVRFKING